MGSEEVLIHFFDRISRRKKVKSRMNGQINFSESTIRNDRLLVSRRCFRFLFLRSGNRILNGDNAFSLGA